MLGYVTVTKVVTIRPDPFANTSTKESHQIIDMKKRQKDDVMKTERTGAR